MGEDPLWLYGHIYICERESEQVPMCEVTFSYFKELVSSDDSGNVSSSLFVNWFKYFFKNKIGLMGSFLFWFGFLE